MAKNQIQSSLLGNGIFCLIYLVTFITFLTALLYQISNQQTQNLANHDLYNIFDLQPYTHINKQLNKKPHLILKAKDFALALEFIKNYALKNDVPLVIRQYSKNDWKKQFFFYTRQLFAFINKKMKWKSFKQNVMYVIISKEAVLKKDIFSVVANKQVTNTIIITNKNLKISGFQTAQFPQKNLAKIFSKEALIPYNITKAYINFYDSKDLFNSLSLQNMNPQIHLGMYYTSVEKISSKLKNILKKICVQGTYYHKLMSISTEQKLQDVGVVVKDNTAYWAHDFFRLNYMIQTGSNCLKTILPTQLIQEAQNICQDHQLGFIQKKKQLEYQRMVKENQLHGQQQDSCECHCKIPDLQKQCKMLFKQLFQKKQKQFQQKRSHILENSQKQDKPEKNSFKVKLTGLDKFKYGGKISHDTSIDISEIQNRIKNPDESLKSKLQNQFSNKQTTQIFNQQQENQIKENRNNNNSIQQTENQVILQQQQIVSPSISESNDL